MADATKFPPLTSLTYFAWQGTPRLSAPIGAADTTISWTVAPRDKNNAVITTPFLFGITDENGNTETILATNGANGTSGLSATGCVRNIKVSGIDYTTSAGAGLQFNQDSPVFCNITAVMQSLMVAALQGTIATGGSGIIIGTDADGTVTVSRSTGAGTSVGWLRWNTAPGVDKAQFSDDGAAWVNFTDTVASVVVKNSANDTTAGYITQKLSAGPGVTLTTVNPAGNENTRIDVSNSGVFSGTAKEAITIGKPVAASTTSGQFENLVNSQITAADAGSPVAFDTGTVTLIEGCQASSTGKVAVIYRESSNWYVIAGTVATDSKVITWGTRQSISADSAAVTPGATYVSDDLVVFTYVRSDNSLKARAASLSGTVFTFDTERSVHAATVNSCSIATVDTNKVLIAFNDSVTFGRMSIGTLSGSVLTVDTANEQSLFAANAISQISVCKAASAKGFVAFRDGTSQDCTQVAVSCGSTTPAGGAPVVADANNCILISCAQITTDKVVVAWQDSTSNQMNARVAVCTGTVVTNPTAELLVASMATSTPLKVIAFGSSILLQRVSSMYAVSVSGTVLSNSYNLQNSNGGSSGNYVTIVKVNDNKKTMSIYDNSTSTSDGTGIVYQDYINTDLYAGIATATAAAAAPITIAQVGIDANQVGLTPGQPVLSSSFPIGKAITATSMEITVPSPGRFGLDRYGADISANDDYVVNLSPAPTAYVTGMQVAFKATTANTGAATLNVNGLGAKTIKKNVSTDLETGDILAGQDVICIYDGTNFQVVSSFPISKDYLANTLPFGSYHTYTMYPSSNTGMTLTNATESRYVNGVRLTQTASGTAGFSSSSFWYYSPAGSEFGWTYGSFHLSYYHGAAEISAGTTPWGPNDIWFAHGMTTGTINESMADITYGNTDRACFAHYNGFIYAITSDGNTPTATQLMADPNSSGPLVMTHYEIVWTKGVSVAFYVNGSLLATHTTTLPDSSSPKFALMNAGFSNAYTSIISGVNISLSRT